MTRRTGAGLLAIGLIAVGLVVAFLLPVNYVTLEPGPTVNVLGDYGGKKILDITGHKTYSDSGELRMLTVYQSGPDQHLNLLDGLSGWISRDTALVPRSAVFGKTDTSKSVQQQSAVEMSDSQDDATAAALSADGIAYKTDVVISATEKGAPADGKIKPGDIIVAVNGVPTTGADQLVKQVRALSPGTIINVKLRRDDKDLTVSMKSVAAPDAPKSARIGVSPGERYVFPFNVDIRLGDDIGGPSAGMMFALSIYDMLTPGSLTGGKTIAGTGEITADGAVGAIGGIGQKMIGAQRAGARLFLAPAANCSEAAHSYYDHKKMLLLKVSTLAEAIKAVDTWRTDPTSASLPRCTT
ncbi:MAG TPA: S16 family serine protease [Marmoricola sp.]|jgi:PDZ domain-containing protein|nr:S16 family serine protease [Marmoricola sp.]